MNVNALLTMMNGSFPSLLALYRMLRDANPDQPALTNDQIFDLLTMDSQQVVTTARAWLDAHPAPPADPSVTTHDRQGRDG